MNLIQIKSSKPTDEQIQAIVRDHREWIGASVMDIETFEREFTDGTPDNLTIETLVHNAEEVENLLLDMCTDPSGFNPDVFIEKLDLATLSNKQKAWLLLKYGKIIEEKIGNAVKSGILQEHQAKEILEVLSRLTNKVMTKAKLPKNLARIGNIKSIIAVGPEIIHEEIVLTNDIPERRKKIVKVA